MASNDQHGEAIRLALRSRYLDDIDSGQERTLAEYQALYPDFEAVVAAEFDRLRNGGEPEAIASESFAGPATEMLGALLPGAHFAGHRLEHLIAQGGQGAVFAAIDPLGRRIALKVLRSPWIGSETAVQRFRLEAKLLATLDHPAICTVYDTGHVDGLHWISMRLVEGETLRERIGRQHARTDGTSPLPPPNEILRAVTLIERVARGVHMAHRAGAVHRDLKPGNLMVQRDGDPVILDFGLAHVEVEDHALTRTGDVLGTPAYMAPEQLRGDVRAIDRRTDVYALGVVLHELVTLGLPFTAPDRSALFAAITTASPRTARSLNPNVSADLTAVISTCLGKLPRDRYQTANDLADDLARVAAGKPVLVRPPSWARQSWERIRRRPVLASLAATVFAMLAGTVVLFLAWNRELEAANRLLSADVLAAEAAEAQSSARLSDFKMLRDLRDVRELDARAETLWPATAPPPSFRTWLDAAAEVVDRLPAILAARERVRGRGQELSQPNAAGTDADSRLVARHAEITAVALAYDTAIGSLRGEAARAETFLRLRRDQAHAVALDFTAGFGGRGWFRFADPADRFEHDQLDQLAQRVEQLRAVTIPALQTRLATSATLRQRSIEDHAAAWQAVITELADATRAPRYGGLALAPMVGLVPLGRDPQSELFEFVDVLTGTVPERDADGQLRFGPDTGVVFVLVPGGRVQLGAQQPSASEPSGPNIDPQANIGEGPVHAVRLDPFLIAKYEMTQPQWLRVTGNNPSHYKPLASEGPDVQTRPVDQVSATECRRWLQRLGFDLPTEAQWEYAARGGTDSPWWTGNERESLAGAANLADAALRRGGGMPGWVYEDWLDDGYAKPAPVASLRANPFGLHHVLGNVWEWTRDAAGSLEHATRDGDGLRQPPPNAFVMQRGGGYHSTTKVARASNRSRADANSKFHNTGVRPMRSLGRRS